MWRTRFDSVEMTLMSVVWWWRGVRVSFNAWPGVPWDKGQMKGNGVVGRAELGLHAGT